MYSVLLAKTAQIEFERADAAVQKKLDRGFKVLATEPRRHNNVKALKGRFAGYFRYRAGNFRIIYRIDDKRNEVFVVDIADRKNVYE